jgi:alkylation response protein AidB-like acyl-CoA dehydrogenase
VPAENVVGGIGNGWRVAKSLLNYERIWIGGAALAASALRVSRALVERTGAGPVLRDRYASCELDLHDHRALYAQICDRVIAGGEPGPEASMLKIISSELLQRVSELNVDLAQDAAALDGDVEIGGITADIGWQYFMARPGTIYAGSNEIQRNLLAKSMLGLGI